jgi:hypothetical protein
VKNCSRGQNSGLQKSFSMGWFEFWVTFPSRSWWLHFTSGCRGFKHALTVMENMWNKRSLIQKNFSRISTGNWDAKRWVEHPVSPSQFYLYGGMVA